MSPLERKLSQGRLRQLPTAWRGAILAQAAAAAAAPSSSASVSRLETSRPSRPSRFWWGLAAIWALLLAAQIDGTGEDARLAARLGPVSGSGWAHTVHRMREVRRLSETLFAQIDQTSKPALLPRPPGAEFPLEPNKPPLP